MDSEICCNTPEIVGQSREHRSRSDQPDSKTRSRSVAMFYKGSANDSDMLGRDVPQTGRQIAIRAAYRCWGVSQIGDDPCCLRGKRIKLAHERIKTAIID